MSRFSLPSSVVLVLAAVTPSAHGADQLSQTPVPGGEVRFFRIAPDGAMVIFDGDLRVDTVDELFTVPIDGALSPVLLNEPLAGNDDVRIGWAFSPDGTRVVYEAPVPGHPACAINSAPTNGSSAPLVLSSSATSLGAMGPEVAAAAPLVLYRGGLDDESSADVYVAPVDQAGQQVNVSRLEADRSTFAFTITADGAHVVYSAETSENGPRALYAAPSSGIGAPIEIAPPTAPGGVYNGLVPTPDGTRIVYRGEAIADEVREVFTAPIDGSSAPVTLNPPLVKDGGIYFAAPSPDSQRVVFAGFVNDAVHWDLYVAPADGSAPATTLSPAGVMMTFVTVRGFTADGARIVFVARDDTGTDALYSVPIDGSAPALMLHAPGVTGASVGTVAVTPDGAHVVFQADFDDDGARELHRAAVDGSSTAETLVDIANESVMSFAVSSDGAFVVYSLGGPDALPFGPGGAGPFTLHALPLDGSADPVVISDPLVEDGVLGPFEIAPDSRTVVYLAEQTTAGVSELFVTTIPSVTCAEDIAGADGVVDFSDLVTILAGWGEDGPGADLAEPFDLVGLGDLLRVLAAWGPCE